MRAVLAITAAFAVIAALFVSLLATPAMATNSNGDECVTTWEWQRDIPQSHTEYKYEKTIPATEGVKEYKYKKLVKGTQAGPDLWWNWSPNYTQGPQDYEPAFPDDPRGTWQGPHENGGPEQDNYGTFQTGPAGNSNWFHREHGTPGTEDSWEYSGWTTEKLGPPWILIDERWKVEPQPEQTVLYKDGAWTTDTPGEPWVKVDERTVTDEPLHQGPVRSADEPDRGDYPDVAWTKVPGSEEQTGDCDNPTGPTPKWTVGDCTDNGQRPVTLTITVPETNEGSTLVRLKKDNVVIDSKQLATFEGEKVATFNLGNLSAGTYTNYSADYSNIYLEGFEPIELGDLVVEKCDDTPPPVCYTDNPSVTRTATAISVTGAKPGLWLALYDADDRGDQTLLVKVQVGEDCKATIPVPPAECETHTYQWDLVSKEPPARLNVDSTGDGVADIPGFIKGELFTVAGDESLCEQPPTKVTPTAPTSVNPCGTANDTYTIPSKDGVAYKANGVVKVAGTYKGVGTVNITAESASDKYVLEGKTSWPFTFTDVKCPVTTPPPSNPPVNNPPTDVAPPPSTDKSDGPVAEVNPFAASLALIALIGAAIAADSRRRKQPEPVPAFGRHRA